MEVGNFWLIGNFKKTMEKCSPLPCAVESSYTHQLQNFNSQDLGFTFAKKYVQ